MADRWSREETRMLIALYKERPALYDPNNKDYLNKVKRLDLIRQIQKELADFKPGVTVSDVKNKMRTLNSQLSRERIKMRNTITTGIDARPLSYSSTLWCFNELEFLANPNDESKGISNTSFGDDEANFTVMSTSSESAALAEEAVPSKPPMKRRRDSFEVNKLVEAARTSIQTAANLLQLHGRERSGDQETKEKMFCDLLYLELQTLQHEEIFDDLTIDILKLVRDTKRREKMFIQEEAHHFRHSSIPTISLRDVKVEEEVFFETMEELDTTIGRIKEEETGELFGE